MHLMENIGGKIGGPPSLSTAESRGCNSDPLPARYQHPNTSLSLHQTIHPKATPTPEPPRRKTRHWSDVASDRRRASVASKSLRDSSSCRTSSGARRHLPRPAVRSVERGLGGERSLEREWRQPESLSQSPSKRIAFFGVPKRKDGKTYLSGRSVGVAFSPEDLVWENCFWDLS